MTRMSNRIRRHRTWFVPILALAWFVFVGKPAEAQTLLAAPTAQGFGQVAVNGLPSVSQPLGYTFSGISVPSFSLAYGSEFNLGTPQCTSSGGVNCTVSVSFQPRWPGLRRDAILVKNTSGNIIATTSLYGTGLGPLVALYPGVISTVAGSLSFPQSVAIDSSGNLYIADSVSQAIREVSGGSMTTLAGSGTPVAVALDGAGNLYIADHDNNVIRKLDAVSHQMSVAVGGGILNGPSDVAVDGAGNLYIADSLDGLIRRVDGASGRITVVAGGGNGGADGVGNGGLAINARLDNPLGVAVDAPGNVYIADAGHSMIRRVDANSGVITAVAGNGNYGYTGDGGAATGAELAKPVCVRLDAAGNLYIADQSSNVIRRVSAQSGVIATIAGNGTPGYSGDGGISTAAMLNAPSGLALDATGSIYIADYANNAVRKISSPSGLSFPSTITGEASSSQTLTVLNMGNQALSFTSVTISPNFRQQSLGAADCSPATVLAPGGLCSVALAFTPAASGSLSGSLLLRDNNLNTSATQSATQSVTLSGTGMTGAIPQIALNASTLTFPMQAVGSSSGAQTVTFSNTGSAALNISSIQLGGANAADFSMTSNCQNVLAAKASCSISLVFTPSGGGARSASVIIADNLANSPQTITVGGTGVPASIAAGSFSLAQGASVSLGYGRLAMQADGNLVLYRSDGVPLWNTGTDGQNCGANQCFALFQGDGNLVVYNAGRPLWNSGTAGLPAAQLVFSAQTPQLEIVSNQSVLWVNQPRFAAGNLSLAQGASLNLGYANLLMQGDGNLVLYRSDGVPLWSTGTYGQNCGANQCFALFQGDGNLVVYNAGRPLWNSGTAGLPAAQLVFSAQAPQLEIVQSGRVLWAN